MQVENAVRHRAAALYGVNPEAMQSLGGSDGAVYACPRDRRDLVLKIVPLSENDLDADLAKAQAILLFTGYLAEHGVPIARTVRSTRGAEFEAFTLDGHGYRVVASEGAPGHHVRARFMNEWNEDLFRRWGQVMGRIHALTQKLQAERDALPVQSWRDEVCFFIDWCDDPEVGQRWQAMRRELERFDCPVDGYGLIHNDLHPHNFLVSGGRLTIIDFDLCAYHWFATGIGIAAFHALGMRLPTKTESPEQFVLRFLGHFMAGYRQENTLSGLWLLRVPTFVDYRRLLLHTVFSHEWGEKPAPRQTKTLHDWRRGILRGEPVVDLSPADLLRL